MIVVPKKSDAQIIIDLKLDNKEMKKELKDSKKLLDGFGKKLGKSVNSKAYANLAKELVKVNSELKKTKTKTNSDYAFKKMSKDLYKTKDKLREVRKELNAIKSGTIRLGGFEKFNKGLGNSVKMAGNLAKTIGKLSLAGGAVSAGIVGATATKAVTSFATFEDAIAAITTIGDVGNVDEFSNKILEASDAINVSAVSLADAVYELYSTPIPKNFPGADMISLAKDVARFAKGSKTDAASAMDLMTNVMAVYRIDPTKSGDMQNTLDTMFASIDFGKIKGSDLAEQFGDVLAPGKELGLSLQELSAGMAAITTAGINPAESATAYKNMIKELLVDNSELNKVLAEGQGKSFDQLRKEGYNIVEILQMISRTADKFDMDLFTLPKEVRAGMGLSVLGGTMNSEFEKMLNAMNGTASDGYGDIKGKTDKAFGIMQDTTKAKLEAIAIDYENFWIMLGKDIETKAGVKNLLGDIDTEANEVLDTLRAGLSTGLVDVFSIIKENKGEIITFISEVLPNLFQSMVNLIQSIAPIIAEFTTWASDKKNIDDFNKSIENTVKILGNVLDVLASISKILGPILQFLPPITGFLATDISELGPKYGGTNKASMYTKNDINKVNFPTSNRQTTININNPNFSNKQQSQAIINQITGASARLGLIK